MHRLKEIRVRVHGIAACLAVSLALLATSLWGGAAYAGEYAFSGGDGTAESPYVLQSQQDLVDFQQAVALDAETYASASYLLTSDVVVSVPWTPVGTAASHFTGSFDGGGHAVDIVVSVAPSQAAGFFGYVGSEDDDAQVSNLIVKGSVSVSGTYDGVGGVAGNALYATFQNCKNEATVSGYTLAGGIVGYATRSTFEGCLNVGSVLAKGFSASSPNYAGGIGGQITNATMRACANRGTVSGYYAGGLIGGMPLAYTDGFAMAIYDCYSAGAISGSYANGQGALIGCLNPPGSGATGYPERNIMQDCYASDECGQTNAIGTAGAEAVDANIQMTNVSVKPDGYLRTATFVEVLNDGYPSSNLPFKRGETYPILQWQSDEIPDGSGDAWEEEHGDDPQDPDDPDPAVPLAFTVSSVADLKVLAASVNGDVPHAAGYDVTVVDDIIGYDGAPIGTPDKPFVGTFDGGGHRIELAINNPQSDYQALIGYAKNAIVRNVIVSGNVTGRHHVAGVVAYATGDVTIDYIEQGSAILNCGNEASVTASSDDGSLSAYNATGGIAGTIDHGSDIAGCYNRGDVTGAYFVGGILGRAAMSGDANNQIDVISCYNTGSVSAQKYVGGIVGRYDFSPKVSGYNSGTVSGCYNAGSVEVRSDSDYYGAIYGYESYSGAEWSGLNLSKGSVYYVPGLMAYNGTVYTDTKDKAFDGAQNGATWPNAVRLESASQLLAQNGVDLMNGIVSDGSAGYKLDENDQNGGFPLLDWEPLQDAKRYAYVIQVSPASATLAVSDGLGREVAPVSSSADAEADVATYGYNLLEGEFSYAVTPADAKVFLPQEGSFAVEGEQGEEPLVIMLDGSRFAATFAVRDGRKGVPLSPVRIALTHAVTGEETVFEGIQPAAGASLGLLRGEYAFTVQVPDYNVESGTIDLSEGSAQKQLDMYRYALVGFTVADAEGEAVADAVATVSNGRDTLTSDADGVFHIPDGTWTFQVDALGYERASMTLVVACGALVSGGTAINVTEDTLAFTLAEQQAWDGRALQEPRHDADGTYLIANAAELAWFAQAVNDGADDDGCCTLDARLLADIDLAGENGPNAWTPIGFLGADGRSYTYYTGDFDGAGHMISGLYVFGGDYLGLFGLVSTGVHIHDVVASGIVSGGDYVGGIAGYAAGEPMFTNVANLCTVRGHKYVGGVAGAHAQYYDQYATFTACTNKGEVTATVADTKYGEDAVVAGIVGSAYSVKVTDCYNVGKVSSNGYNVGGIVGSAWTTTEITGCYSAGEVISTFNHEVDYGDWYNTANGAIIGLMGYSTSVGSNNVWVEGTAQRGVGFTGTTPLIDTSESADYTPATLLSAVSALSSSGAYLLPSDSSFNAGWPRLTWENESHVADEAPVQDGSRQRPWVIASYDDLVAFMLNVNGGHTYAGEYVVLDADIDVVADSVLAERSDVAITCIGFGSGAPSGSSAPFSGTFDGCGHTISGLQVNGGVFRNLYGATVTHLHVQGTSTGSGVLGGLVGYANSATITDCLVEMDVVSTQHAAYAERVAGIAGDAYNSTLIANVFKGTVTVPETGLAPMAINGGTYGSSTHLANYYLATDGSAMAGVNKGDGTSWDVAGEAEGVESLDSPELAWLLNTRNDSQLNDGIWGNVTGDGVRFANGVDVKAVYKVNVSTVGASLAVHAAYAIEGDDVGYSNVVAKKGYTLAGGVIVRTVVADDDEPSTVYADAAAATAGTFTMPAADVVVSVSTTFDPTTVYAVSVGTATLPDDDAQRSAMVVAEPASGTAGTKITVLVSDVDAASRVVELRVCENDVHAAPVAFTTRGIGQRYEFTMPRADVRVEVVLGPSDGSEGSWWPSSGAINAARHIQVSSYASNGNYMGALLAIDGAAGTGLETEGGVGYRSTRLVDIADVETASSVAAATQYRGTYSLLDGNGGRISSTFQGIILYDYLVRLGMNADVPDETPVTFSNAQGEVAVLTVGQLRSKGYVSYAVSGADAGLAQADCMPVILAYGENDTPIAMDVASTDADGNPVRYEQRTPYTLVVGQRSYDDENWSLAMKGVDRIVVGDELLNDQHNHQAFRSYLDDAITVKVHQDGETISTTKVTVAEVEQAYCENPQARELLGLLGTQYYGTGIISSDLVHVDDCYDGIDVATLLRLAGAVPASSDMSQASVGFSSDGGTGAELSVEVPWQYLAGGDDPTHAYEGNVVEYYGQVTGVRPFIAFGKNGYPLAYDGSCAEYVNDAYNRYGPLIAVLPANASYGVAGASMDAEGNPVSNDARLVTYLSVIDVYLTGTADDQGGDDSGQPGDDPADSGSDDGHGTGPGKSDDDGSADGSANPGDDSSDTSGEEPGKPDGDQPKASIAGATVGGLEDGYAYTGSAIEPAIVVTMPDGTVLQEGADYTLSFTNNIGPGAAAVTVTGTGSYEGVLVRTFSVNRFHDINYGTDWVDTEGWLAKVVERNLMGGYKDGQTGEPLWLFGPEDDVTRGQVAVILYRYANPESRATNDADAYEPNKVGVFTDNEGYSYFTAAINWAFAEGIMTGDKNGDGSYKGTVRPNDSITREELATMLARFAGAGPGSAAGGFRAAPDANDVSEWAAPFVSWCYEHGVMTGGKADGHLNPQSNATRAQAAKMITVTVEQLEESEASR